jgi:P27 family predicted phage terminase small subunit
MLTRLDESILAVYCTTHARWLEAERLLECEALTARGSNNNVIVNPLTKIAQQSARDLCRHAAELGLSPSARARMRAGWNPPDGANKFSGLLAGDDA